MVRIAIGMLVAALHALLLGLLLITAAAFADPRPTVAPVALAPSATPPISVAAHSTGTPAAPAIR